MNIYNKKEKNKTNSNQLVIEQLSDLLKLSPDKLKNAHYSDFSGKYFDQIIDEVIKSEKNPKIPAINNQKKQINYQQKNNYEDNKFNDNNNDINIDNENQNKMEIIDMNNQIEQNNNNNNYYNIQYQRINSSFSQNNSLIKHTNNSPIINYNNINDSSHPIKKIIFKIYYDTVFGQEIAISGSNNKLGNWDKNKLLFLEWSKGNKWMGEIDIDELEDFEFKFVVCFNKEIASWEPGENNNVYFTALYNEIKDYPKGRYNKYEYEYDKNNGELVLNCKWQY